MPKKEKKCIQCGGIHTKHKFCSDPCRKQYHLDAKSVNSDVSSNNITSIIYGIRTGVQSDQGYGFVFSSEVGDWVVGQKLKRLKKQRTTKPSKI